MTKKSMTNEKKSELFWKTLKELNDNLDLDGMIFGGMLIEAGIGYVMHDEKLKTKADAIGWIRDTVNLNSKRYKNLELIRKEKKARDAA